MTTSNSTSNSTSTLLEPLRARWAEIFGRETLPPLATFRHWCDRYPAPVLDGAFRATEKRSTRPGEPMTHVHRHKFFSSVAARLSLDAFERRVGQERYQAFKVVANNFATSKGGDAETGKALDLLEVLCEQGLSAFWSAYFANTTSPYREQAECMLRRLGTEITFDQMRAEASKPVN